MRKPLPALSLGPNSLIGYRLILWSLNSLQGYFLMFSFGFKLNNLRSVSASSQYWYLCIPCENCVERGNSPVEVNFKWSKCFFPRQTVQTDLITSGTIHWFTHLSGDGYLSTSYIWYLHVQHRFDLSYHAWLLCSLLQVYRDPVTKLSDISRQRGKPCNNYCHLTTEYLHPRM